MQRYGTRLRVGLGQLARNYEKFSRLSPRNEAIFMIKSQAYGHGLRAVADFAWKDLEVKSFGVASLGEAVELRRGLPSMNARIFVFSDLNLDASETRQLYLDYNILPVIGTMEDLRLFLDERDFSMTPLVLKVDTGMHRMGVGMDELEAAANEIKSRGRRSVAHLMTHFASSFLKFRKGDKTSAQLEAFKEAKAVLATKGIAIEESSCANSGALEQGLGLEESHVRPGLMLYGPASVAKNGEASLWTGGDISSFETKIIKSFPVKKGTPVGYGGHVCHADGHVVYVPAGYGDGFLTYYSKGDLRIEGFNARVLGRVNMDMSALFFPAEAGKILRQGKGLKLWESGGQSVLALAGSFKTTPYQVLTAVGARIPRFNVQ